VCELWVGLAINVSERTVVQELMWLTVGGVLVLVEHVLDFVDNSGHVES
jgi:hypothetical protein